MEIQWFQINQKLYVNLNSCNSTEVTTFGGTDGTITTTNSDGPLDIGTSSVVLSIGSFLNYAYYYKGKIDEVRFSNTVRNPDWIKFEYNNMNSADQELTWTTL